MASYASYPSGSDVGNFLSSAGLVPAASADLDAAADLGRDAFEKAAGRIMLAAALDVDDHGQTRRFDPAWNAGGVLEVDDIASFLGLSYFPYGGQETALVREEDFELLPYHAPEKGRPYTAIRFYRYTWFSRIIGGGTHTNARSIRIEAQFGYGLTLSAAVHGAMCMLGAASLAEAARQNETGGLLGWSSAGHQAQYGELTLKALQEGWEKRGLSVACQYRKAGL